MTTRTLDSLDGYTTRQDGLITRAQLRSVGIDDMAMYRRTRNGMWQRVLPAVYLTHGGPLSDEQRRIAAVLFAGASAQITGIAALGWYGFRYAPQSPTIHVLVPHEEHRKSRGFVRVQRTHDLDVDARQAGLYTVCSPGRAVVDACRELGDRRTVRAIVAETIQRGYCGTGRLDREIRRAARSRTALVRAAFDEAVNGIRSAPEGDLMGVMRRSAILPPALWNPTLVAPDGTRLPTPDGYLPDAAMALEVDSREFHFSPDDWGRTLTRHNVLAGYGILVLHFTPAQIRDTPAEVLRAIERAYVARREEGVRVSVVAR